GQPNEAVLGSPSCNNYRGVDPAALVCIRKSPSGPVPLRARDKPPRRHDNGIAASSLPRRKPSIRAPAPTPSRVASAGRASPFLRDESLLARPLRELLRPVGHDQIRARALEGSHDFKDGGAFFETPFFGASLHHRELAAHMINGGRFFKTVTHPPENIEIRQRG